MSTASASPVAGAAVRKGAEQFQQLRKAFEARDDGRCDELLTELRRTFTLFPTFMDPAAAAGGGPTAIQEVILVRDVLEHAVLLAARRKDMEELEAAHSQLHVYYADVRLDGVPAPEMKMLITGLNMVRLLVCNKVAEFHSTLDRLPRADGTNMYIKFAVQLERCLMEGSYNKLLHARSLAPSNDFVPVVDLLSETVRAEVIRCIPLSYATLSVADAQKLLLYTTRAEVEAQGTKLGWALNPAGTHFVFSDTSLAKKDIDFSGMLAHAVGVAAELQRVV